MGKAMANAELRTARARVHVYTYRYETPSHHTRSPDRDVLALFSKNALGSTGIFRSAGTTSRMVPLGGLMIIPSETSISAVGPGGDRRLAVCTMAGGILPKEFDRHNQHHLAMCADIRDVNVRVAMQRMAAEVEHPGFGSDILIDGLSAVMQVDLTRYFSLEAKREPTHRGKLAPWQLRRLEDYVQAADGVTLRIADLAALVDVSPGHLGRAFKQSTGRTVHRFVEEARLARAHVLLGETHLPLKQVAAQLGFNTPGSFSQAFRRATGSTPGQFRSEAARGD